MKWSSFRTQGSNRIGVERVGHSSTLCGHLVFVHGGGRSSTLTPAFNDLVFNTKTKRWKTLDCALEIYHHSASLVDDKLIFIGGKPSFMMNGIASTR